MTQPYLSLEAELHDAFWDAEDDGSEVRLMQRFLKKHPGIALEIGSGSGRLMFPLLQAGFEIEGLELSTDMLKLGRARAAKLALRPTVHQGDMSSWSPARPYSSLLAPAFTLQLAPDPETALRHWHSMITPHGGLYLTIFIPYAELLGDLPENEWYQDHTVTFTDGREGLLETRHRLDVPARLVHREHRYSISGNPPLTHHSRQTIRWFEHQEIIDIMQKCGFHCDHFFLDFDPDQIVSDPDRVDFGGILTYQCTRF